MRLVPFGESIWSVFGNGNPDRGKKLVMEMVSHPEVVRGSQVGNYFEFVSIADTEDPQTKQVVIRRFVQITTRRRDNEEVRDEEYLRTFAVRFDLDKNCIVAVTSVDTEWQRIR